MVDLSKRDLGFVFDEDGFSPVPCLIDHQGFACMKSIFGGLVFYDGDKPIDLDAKEYGAGVSHITATELTYAPHGADGCIIVVGDAIHTVTIKGNYRIRLKG